MKCKDLIGHSHLTQGQYIVVIDVRNSRVFSSEGIGRYNFGRYQEQVLAMKVNSFEPTEFGLRIYAEEGRRNKHEHVV